MPTYLDKKRRRISQFAEHLRLMGLRAHKLAKGSCFIIFDETPPEDAESPKVKESVAIKVDSLTAGGSASGGPGGDDPCPDLLGTEQVRWTDRDRNPGQQKRMPAIFNPLKPSVPLLSSGAVQ